MKTIGYVYLLFALAIDAQTVAPIVGTWEARLHGLQAMTLAIHEDGGNLSGAAIFYLLKSDRAGWHNAGRSDPLPLINPRWDGKTLRFSISHGDWLAPFELRLTSFRTVQGKRLAAHGEAEQQITLRRQQAPAAVR